MPPDRSKTDMNDLFSHASDQTPASRVQIRWWHELSGAQRQALQQERALSSYFTEKDENELVTLFLDNHTFDEAGNKIIIPYLKALVPVANRDIERLSEMKNFLLKQSLRYREAVNPVTGRLERYIGVR